MISRRESFKLIATGAAVGLTGAVVVNSCVADPAPASESSIASMFQAWRNLNNQQSDKDYIAAYQALQERIVSAEPQSVRDVAMQVLVDMDMGCSEMSNGFENRLFAIAGVERRAG